MIRLFSVGLLLIGLIFGCGKHPEEQFQQLKIINSYLSHKTSWKERFNFLDISVAQDIEDKYKAFIRLSSKYDENFSLNPEEVQKYLNLNGIDFFTALDKVRELKPLFEGKWEVSIIEQKLQTTRFQAVKDKITYNFDISKVKKGFKITSFNSFGINEKVQEKL